MTSLNAALEYCDYVETDVRITADNNLILFHDPDLNERFIKELTTEEIFSQLDNVKKDELILSSRDQIKGKVNFEIKTDSLLQPQIDILFQKMLPILHPKILLLHLIGNLYKILKNYFLAGMASYLITRMRCLRQSLYQYMTKTCFLWLKEHFWIVGILTYHLIEQLSGR